MLTARGMASSLGGVVQACAALRAGIARPRPIPQMQVVAGHDQVPIPLTGHPVHGLTEGYPVGPRWIRLAAAAFADFRTQPGAPAVTQQGFWTRCDVVVVLPSIRHQRFQTADVDCMPSLQAGVIAPLIRVLGIPVDAEAVTVVDAGQAGTASALVRVRERILAGEVQAGLILAVDSHLDGMSLEWLAANRRLKCDGQPCGLAPGEAGVCLLIESGTSAAARAASVSAVVAGIAYAAGTEAAHSMADGGRRLADAVASALGQSSGTTIFAGPLITDHNGEAGRSEAIAMALQLLHQRRLVAGNQVVIPASSLGDTGAASGAVGVCVAAHGFLRQPQAGAAAAVVSLGELGDPGVVVLTRAG
ncbi:MAG: hypothetical protein H0W78_03630 [Planctomycetes bacterium]|nr:hypothetical protein [Planctomycetota bacterium]